MTEYRYEEWAGLCEISNDSLTKLGAPKSLPVNVILHLCRPNHHPLASVVLQPVPLDDSRREIDNTEQSRILLHPLLHEFLLETLRLVDDNQQPQEYHDDQHNSIRVRIRALPIEPIHTLCNEQNQSFCNDWRLKVIPVAALTKLTQVVVSCIFADFQMDHDTASLETLLAESLEGRVIMVGCSVLICPLGGSAVLKVEAIEPSPTMDTGLLAMRLDAMDSFQVRIKDKGMPLLMSAANDNNNAADDHRGRLRMQDIPGYEPLLDEVLELLGTQGSPESPSGVLLTGCSGVGKSRLASCVGWHYTHTNKQTGDIYFLSVHDLFFRAATTEDLYQEVLLPQLESCSLWIIDDLSLLDQTSDGDQDQRSMEYTSVLTSIARGIDLFQTKCPIVGIGQRLNTLPNELTKVGRLEKVLEMMAPTQLQRQHMWKHLLRDAGIDPTLKEQWIPTLVAGTAGCVAADMIRVYDTAMTRALARSSDLVWEDLREATRSCVPSQLAELDVTKPRSFDPSLTWPQMNQLSWDEFGGYDAVKKQVYRNVVAPWKNFLKRIETAQSQEANWLAPPSGVIFHGPSGCGKTFAARCMADSLQLPMVQIRATDVLNKYLGGSEALLRSFFARARAASPCILFIDEIDSISNNRSEDDTDELGARILSTLLNEMDGVSSSKKNRVLVVACSNRLEAIDSALLRSGRLEEHLYLGYPSPHDLSEILRLQTSRMPLDERLSLDSISERLFELQATAADLEGLCREACFIAFRRLDNPEKAVILPEDFDRGLQQFCHSKATL